LVFDKLENEFKTNFSFSFFISDIFDLFSYSEVLEFSFSPLLELSITSSIFNLIDKLVFLLSLFDFLCLFELF
jgi:hypothetical protein